MKKVALTGNIGSGKTTIARIFSTLGTAVYNADKEAHKLFLRKDVKKEVALIFGNAVFKDNEVDRKALGAIVFGDEKALGKLNSIIHPLVLDDFKLWAKHLCTSKNYVLFESAIIYEAQLTDLFDAIILVRAPKELRVQRIMLRDKLPHKKIMARIDNQIPEEHLSTQDNYQIINDGRKMLIPQVITLDKKLNDL